MKKSIWPYININSILIVSILFILSCEKQKETIRSYVDISGQWQFAIDTANVGLKQKWFNNNLNDTINLPGTTDLNKKGFVNRDTSTKHLNRIYVYEGPAWYKKKVFIEPEFAKKHISLFLERTKSTKVWIDDQFVGSSRILESPQKYDVSEYLIPGEHTITICVNNNLKLTPYGNVHIYSDDTQTNWNGIIGDIYLEITNKTYISDLQIFPDISENKISTKISINNGLDLDKVEIDLIVNEIGGNRNEYKSLNKKVKCDSLIEVDYHFGDNIELWDDYKQPLYNLTVSIRNDSIVDKINGTFGMRDFSVKGKQFSINNRITFLRGKHDACVFPLTGHPPMEKDGWLRVFTIAKSYGINHYRFHSYCPPEAAFKAADEIGIFLQPELPFWGGLDSDTLANMLLEEGKVLLKNYGNHPSFVMFGPGNEIWSGHERVERIIQALKKTDSRHLYTIGANNNIGYVGPKDCSDFHIAARTPFKKDTLLTHTRLTHAFADSRDGGILNNKIPSTKINYDYPVEKINVPLISHEIGQYQIYPDFNEIKKYTGVLKPWNLHVFQNGLENAGMADQNLDFQKASGFWSAQCYKAEMEAALRTDNMAGFQLLDLQDFPGQGTALVGILDAFMESKNVISREEWIESCNDVVILLEFEKYCWQNNERFSAVIKIANYSNTTFNDDVIWSVTDKLNNIKLTGSFKDKEIKQGKLLSIGKIEYPLDFVKSPEKLTINLNLKSDKIENTYSLWVYPKINYKIDVGNIKVVENFDDVLEYLKYGDKVLFFPKFDTVKNKSVEGLFPPDFWNYGMFKGISEWVNKKVSPGTLGILTDPLHSIYNNFPTEFHTNWQWFTIIKNSRPLILNKAPKNFRPIVQVIDNVERNNKYGLIFEFKVGKGKLLVCMSRLQNILDTPESFYLYKSILTYMNSDRFNPVFSVSPEFLKELF